MAPKTPKKRTKLKHLLEAKVNHGLAADGTEYEPEALEAAIIEKGQRKADRLVAELERENPDAEPEEFHGPVEFLSFSERFYIALNEARLEYMQ